MRECPPFLSSTQLFLEHSLLQSLLNLLKQSWLDEIRCEEAGAIKPKIFFLSFYLRGKEKHLCYLESKRLTRRFKTQASVSKTRFTQRGTSSQQNCVYYRSPMCYNARFSDPDHPLNRKKERFKVFEVKPRSNRDRTVMTS